MTPEQIQAMRQLLYRLADDQLIIGHRNSEWTGLGPVLEEDIAFSSIAQDKVGHAHALYQLLHQELAEPEPDTIAFMRDEKDFFCCQLVEMPIGEYDFSLIRHWLFDLAEQIRFDAYAESQWVPLAKVARKIKGEIKYHVFHAETWVKTLAEGTEESKARMQSALNEVLPMAMGMFECKENNALLAEAGWITAEAELQNQWEARVKACLQAWGLQWPAQTDASAFLGGRHGYHTEHLQPLLNEMTEVYRLDPSAEW